MPFTPLHMGPGILLKALLQGCSSLMVFGWSQIVMDLQPLWVMVRGQGHMHGFSHTFMGATIMAVLSALSGKYLAEFGLLVVGMSRKSRLINISWPAAFLSAYLGCFSHVILDSIMHTDVQPFWPFSVENPLLGMITVRHLHQFCLYTGVLGAVVFYAIQWRNRRA